MHSQNLPTRSPTANGATGAGSGLGEAGAKRLARAGAKLVVADRNLDRVERVAKEINGA
ncbi:SDR family NAD(P)-dependent oxidoreductase [Streptomyces sp. NPDC005574]|uniref:SDR family NAD(P)-dependent oxidoreductase n=1 Tax=Streptomyces sp. NPDC005574 TaxID=3156891 RepID=UPI0033AF33CE